MNTRLLASRLTVAAMLAASLGYTPQAAAQSAAPALTIMPIGDSVTSGYKSSTGDGYREDLKVGLTGTGSLVNFVGSLISGTMSNGQNEGHSGYRIDQIASIITSLVQRYQPNVVPLLIGTNDLGQNYNVSTAPNRLMSLIDQILAAQPDAVVLVGSLPPSSDAAMETRVTTYNAAVKSVVASEQQAGKHVGFADLGALTLADMSDSLHPNDAGYQLVANAFAASIQTAKAAGWIASRAPLIPFSAIFQIQNLASSLDLDVNAGSTAAGAAVVQSSAANATELQWRFVSTGNGSYRVENVKSGLDLHVSAGSTSNGGLIVQEAYDGSGASQWFPVPNADGSYSFYNVGSNLSLDDPGGSQSSGRQFEQWVQNRGTNQAFRMVEQSASLAGRYQILSVSNGLLLNVAGKSTAAGAPVIEWINDGGSNALWTFIPASNGNYRIENVNSGLDLAVSSATSGNGAAVIQSLSNGSSSSLWKPVQDAAGNYVFYNANSNLLLDVPGGIATPGTQFDQWGANGGTNQKFTLIPN